MSKAHTGHNGNTGVQNHSCGDSYPFVVTCVGGFPREDNEAYAEVTGPVSANGKYLNVFVGRFNTHAEAEAVAIKWAKGNMFL